MNTFILRDNKGISYKYTTVLPKEEFGNRLKRLDTLRVLTEQHDCEDGRSICSKAVKAYNKTNGFTGIIRLTFQEKDWLSYMLESDYLDDEDKECIKFYVRG